MVLDRMAFKVNLSRQARQLRVRKVGLPPLFRLLYSYEISRRQLNMSVGNVRRFTVMWVLMLISALLVLSDRATAQTPQQTPT